MKKHLFFVLVGAAVLSAATGCKDQTPKTEVAQAPAQTATAPAATMQGKTGTVVETVNSAGYTYVQVDTGSEKIWAAAPEFQVKVGDSVAVPEGMAMPNYHSKTLNRDFDLVYFVPAVMVGGMDAMMASSAPAGDLPSGHPSIAPADPSTVDFTGVTKAEGGKTVEEIFTAKADLAGKEVAVRGKVVKYSPEIMGKNWIHLQDGTGSEGTNDLTITTSSAAKVGDTVLVSGAITLDKDFGHGYQYDVIVEDAKVTVE